MTQKTTVKTDTPAEVVEDVVYVYNLQNKLSLVTTTKTANLGGDGQFNDQIIEETTYQYDPEGNRIGSAYTRSNKINGGSPAIQEQKSTKYLIDPSNPTGYAQVLQEIEYDASGQPHYRTDYVLGDDVISQTKSTWATSDWSNFQTQYLLYDGHGSTRQLLAHSYSVDAGSGKPIVAGSYSYDGYGVMLSSGSGANAAANAGTSLLYTGEQYDKSLSQYYLRARYYNPLNGLFNQMDPYAGNTQDPQSLHKYLYCHANPVNCLDPEGLFTLVEITSVQAIQGILRKIDYAYGRVYQAYRVKNAFEQVMGLLDFFNRMSQFLERIISASNGGSLASAFIQALQEGFGQAKESFDLNFLYAGFNEMFSAFGSMWQSFRQKFQRNIPKIALEASTDPTLLAVAMKHAAIGKHVPIVIDLPSPPTPPWTRIRLPKIKFGKNELIIQSGKKTGRFFGLGYIKGIKQNDEEQYGNILRIDYIDYRGELPIVAPHYHVGSGSDNKTHREFK